MAGALATLSTHPFDVMKVSQRSVADPRKAVLTCGLPQTRMQVQSKDVQYRSLGRTVAGIFKVSFIHHHPPLHLSELPVALQERGLVGFFDGVSIRIGRKVFSSAISWTVYETLLIFWRDRSRYT